MSTAKKVLALALCFLIALSSFHIAQATEDPPSPSATIEEPIPTPTAEEPTPTPTAEEPLPTPTAEEPTPSPTAEEPAPTPTMEEPTPSPTAEEPTPTPTAEEPTPTPTAEEPTPTPTAEEPTPTPTAEVPTPIPTTEERSQSGYAELLAAANLYSNSQTMAKVATISEGVVYAISRTEINASKDRFFVAFAIQDSGIITGYVDAHFLRLLSPVEAITYIASLETAEFFYCGNHDTPLAFIQYTPNADEPELLLETSNDILYSPLPKSPDENNHEPETTPAASPDAIEETEPTSHDAGMQLFTASFEASALLFSTIAASDVTLEASPNVFDLYSGSTNHVNMIITWSCDQPLSFVGISGLTEITHYTVSGNSVILNTSYLTTLPVGDHTLSFNFYGGTSLAIEKQIKVVDTSPVCSVNPSSSTFDRNSSSEQFKDLVFECSGAAFTEIISLTKGLQYNVAGNTVTVFKEYLAALSVTNHNFQFRFGDGDGVIVNVNIAIIDSNWQGMTVDSVPISSGSGVGWSYTSNILTISSGEHTISGNSDYTAIVLTEGVTGVTLNNLIVNTSMANALTYNGSLSSTLTVQISGNSILNSNGCGLFSPYSSFVLLGGGSLEASGIHGNNITIRSGTYVINAPDSINYGISAEYGNLIISGGSITATVNGYASRYGLYARNNINISNGTFYLSSDAYYPFPIYSDGSVIISGGSITTVGHGAGDNHCLVNSIGIRGKSFTMSGGTVNITSTATSGYVTVASGISVAQGNGNITINGGNINIYTKSTTGEHKSYGLEFGNENGKIEVNGGTINISIDCDAFGYGIFSYSTNVVVNGGRISTNSQYGLSSRMGDILIYGGRINTTGTYGLYTDNKNILLDGASVAINSKGNTLYASGSVTVKNSILAADNIGGAASLDNTLFFKGNNNHFTLESSGNINRDLYLPEDNAYIVPAGLSITISDGAKLKLGGTLVNDGLITGMVTDANGNPIKASAVEMSSAYADLTVGSNVQLSASVKPNYAYNRSLVWASSNPAVATVDINGLVTAVSIGQATITATSQDVASAVGICTVTIIQQANGVNVISPSNEMLTFNTIQLTASVMPENTTNKTVLWTSSNPALASVDQNGLVTALNKGVVTITATINGLSSSVVLHIMESPKPSSVSIGPKNITMNLNDIITLTPSLTPVDARTSYKWTTLSGKILSVNNGIVTALKEGRARVKVTTDNRKTATVTITVVDPHKPSGVSLNHTGTVTLNLGEQLTLVPSLSPISAMSNFTWKASSSRIATVSDGVVTAMKEGTTTIKVYTYNKKSASVKVRIVDPHKPSGISLNYSGTVTMNLGEQLTLIPSLAPVSARSDFSWKTSSSRIATVSDGVVTALKEGTTTIKVYTYNKKSTSVKVRIVDPYKPSGVSLNFTGTVTMNLGEQLTLIPSLAPVSARSEISWKTSSSKIATVSYGVVTALKEGTTTIKVYTYNNKSASIRVKVIKS